MTLINQMIWNKLLKLMCFKNIKTPYDSFHSSSLQIADSFQVIRRVKNVQHFELFGLISFLQNIVESDALTVRWYLEIILICVLIGSVFGKNYITYILYTVYWFSALFNVTLSLLSNVSWPAFLSKLVPSVVNKLIRC